MNQPTLTNIMKYKSDKNDSCVYVLRSSFNCEDIYIVLHESEMVVFISLTCEQYSTKTCLGCKLEQTCPP